MNNIKYFFQFIFIITFFFIFKILGLRLSNILSAKIFNLLGPLFRSNKISHQNLSTAFPELDRIEKDKILKKMWYNYGKIFSEYLFIKEIKESKNIIVIRSSTSNRTLRISSKSTSGPV